jgi:hypothetical protein
LDTLLQRSGQTYILTRKQQEALANMIKESQNEQEVVNETN